MEVLIISIILIVILAISLVWTHPWGAPWVPSSLTSVQQMLDLAEVKPDELVYDLGCGDGRIVVTAALRYKAQAVGIELDPLRWLWCQILVTVLGLRDKIRIEYGDLFKQDLSDADIIICYLLPNTNKKLQDKLLRELRPGTRVVSNTFLFPGVKEAAQKGKTRLYLFSPENTTKKYIERQLRKSAGADYPGLDMNIQLGQDDSNI
jgi:SAM-dependent methyltransferase